MRWLFWEVDVDSLDADRDADFVLARLLEFGRMADVRWAMKHYGLDRIHRFFREVGHPELSGRTLAFWRAVFQAEDEPWQAPPDWRRNSNAPWSG
jgi:hypothetical protein